MPGLGLAVDRFAARLDRLAARGIEPARLRFEEAYGRTSLEYYDGFVFGASAPSRPDLPAIASGGRYDALTRALGGGARHPRGRRHRAAGGAVGAVRLRLGLPSKGRLRDEAVPPGSARAGSVIAMTAPAGSIGRGVGVDGVELVLLPAAEVPRELAAGAAAPRRHRTGPGSRGDPALGGAGGGACADGVRRRRPGGRGARLLDRRRQHVRPRPGGGGVPGAARSQARGRYEVPPPGARFLPGRTASPTMRWSTAKAPPRRRCATRPPRRWPTSPRPAPRSRDNHLRVLEDGLILKSQATLFAARAAPWNARTRTALAALGERSGLTPPAGLWVAWSAAKPAAGLARPRHPG